MPWYINDDLESLVAFSRAIIGPNLSEYCYAPSDPHEGDSAPYPLTSGAQVTTAVVKVNGLLFGRFHTVSHSAFRPPTSPLLAIPKTQLKNKKEGFVVLDKTELEKVLSGLGLGKLSEDDANKVLANLRYNNGGSTQFAADMKSYKEDLELYESKKASLLQQHPYADGKRGGYHAEDAFLSAWTEFKKSKIYQDIKEAGKGKFYVSLKLSKTPCEKCTPRLIKFVRDEKDVKLRIKAQRIYTKKGETLVEGVSRMQELIASGIPVKAWMLEERVGKKATTKELQLHELSFWDFKPLDPQEVLFMKDLKDKLAASTKQINLYLPGKGLEKYNADRDYKSASRHSEEGKVGKIVI